MPANPRSVDFLQHCPGYEEPLTRRSTPARLRDGATSAKPGCICGNKRRRTMPVRLQVVLLPQDRKALDTAWLLSIPFIPSKSTSSKKYSSAFFSWLIICPKRSRFFLPSCSQMDRFPATYPASSHYTLACSRLPGPRIYTCTIRHCFREDILVGNLHHPLTTTISTT